MGKEMDQSTHSSSVAMLPPTRAGSFQWAPVALLFASIFYSNISLAEADISADFSLEDLLALDTIEVTARKRTENLQDVPVSLSVLRGDYLNANSSGAKDIRFLSSRVPSLTVESSYGRTYPRFYIRGLGNTDFDLNASQPVSIVFDGIVQENPILKGIPVFDTDRIEVLRGPQGTLFGRNTPAGIIKIESKKPTEEFEAYADMSYGTRNTIDFEGAVGGSLSETLNARISLLRQSRPDWVDNKAPGFEESDAQGGFSMSSVRLQVDYALNDQAKFLLNLHAYESDGKTLLFRANVLDVGSNSLNSNFDADTIYHDASENSKQEISNNGASLQFEYDFGSYSFISITGYESVEIFSRGDVDGGYGAVFLDDYMGPGLIPFPSESSDGIPDHSQFTQEVRISSNDGEIFNYQVGLFYFAEDLDISSMSFDTFGEGFPQNGEAIQNQKTTAVAIFGSFDYLFSDKYKATLGLRYSSDEKDFVAERLQGPFGSGTIAPIKIDTDDSHVSWDLSGVYKVNDRINWYTRVADSFRAPSLQGRILFGSEVTVADSEIVLSVETGIKAVVFDERGRINVSVYSFSMDDQQITAVGGGSNFNRLVNVKNTKGYGLEIDSEYILNQNWHLMVNLGYNNTEINSPDLVISACSSCTITDELDANDLAKIDGNNLPMAPERIVNIALRYQRDLARGSFYAYGDLSYRSEIDIFLYQSAEFLGEELQEVGMRVGYRWTTNDTDYDVTLFGRNITDEQVLVGGIDFNNLTGMVNDPRFIGAGLRVSF